MNWMCHVRKYVDGNCSAAMLATKRSVGVTLVVNLRILLHVRYEACKPGDPPGLWNPGQTSPDIQNSVISGSTKGHMSCIKIFLKKLNVPFVFCVFSFTWRFWMRRQERQSTLGSSRWKPSVTSSTPSLTAAETTTAIGTSTVTWGT